MGPDINYLVISFIVGDKAHTVVIENLIYLLIPFINQFLLLRRNDYIVKVKRKSSLESHLITKVLNIVKEFCSGCSTCFLQYRAYNIP